MKKNPRRVYFFNPKGGVGKTTCATQTAVAIVANGLKVAFIDKDKQKSATAYFATIAEKYRPQFISDEIEVSIPEDTDIIIVDCGANDDFIPPNDGVIVSPTSSTYLDLQVYRIVLRLAEKGYKVIKVINNFNMIRNDDKGLLKQFGNCCVITANSAIRHAMKSGKSIWNSNKPGGTKAKNQFEYLLSCIAKGEAPELTIEKLNEISDRDRKANKQ